MANVNLHPSFFQQNLPIQPKKRTSESIEIERALPVNLQKEEKRGYKLFDETFLDSKPRNHITLGTTAPTLFSNRFFSNDNIQSLHNMIRYLVFKQTGKVIEQQSEEDLLIIMRSIYFQFSTMPTDDDFDLFQDEIDRLNLFVLRDAVPDVLSNMEAYFGYLRDASQPLQPIPRAVNLSNKGTKELRSVMDILSPNGDPRSNGIKPVLSDDALFDFF